MKFVIAVIVAMVAVFSVTGAKHILVLMFSDKISKTYDNILPMNKIKTNKYILHAYSFIDAMPTIDLFNDIYLFT